MCYNKTNGDNFLVHLTRGEVRRFQQCPRGFFYYDMIDAQATVLVNTEESNLSRYSERDYYRELDTRKIQYKVVLTSHRHLVKIAENKNHMDNCPLNRDGVKGVEDICRDSLVLLTRNKPRKNTPHIRATLMPIPMTVLQH